MKQRTPVYVTISIILVILFIVYYMFVQNSSFLASPYFWGTVVISSILALIHHAIGDLIENDKFKKLTEAEQLGNPGDSGLSTPTGDNGSYAEDVKVSAASVEGAKILAGQQPKTNEAIVKNLKNLNFCLLKNK